MRRLPVLAGFLLTTLSVVLQAAAPAPHWIWGTNAAPNELRFFRRVLELPTRPRKATLTIACDDQAVISVNDQAAGRTEDWKSPTTVNLTRFLTPGPNTISILARNQADAAGLLARLELTLGDGAVHVLVTDNAWETSTDGASDWAPAHDLGAHGIQPWGTVLKSPQATPAESLRTLPGFQVELIRSADVGEGSWVSMSFDPKGRLWISPQGTEPLLRATLTNGQVSVLQPVPTPARAAMGLLWAFDSLYVNGRGTNGLALYRLQDANGDDTFDRCDVLQSWKGDGGEHGPHGIASDGTHLFVINGNFVTVPTNTAPTSPVRSSADDVVLPRMEDGNGSANGRKPPGGYIVRMKPDGSGTELFSAGQRNAYDLAFNEDGELFTFDSDMEGDWGLPWYRPNRILHCFAGADHGFREGSAKWPAYYADSMGSVVDAGLGSPTGLTFGSGTRFPTAYQKALFAMDWSFGRILAFHLQPDGATYTASMEPFIQGRPLNVTDLAVGPDGALYFITGGRGIQSGLYRVTWTGQATSPAAPSATPSPARQLRTQLTDLARTESPDALEKTWPHLGSPDPAIRYAARLALERQSVATWKSRALAESNAPAGLTALLALARYGSTADQPALLKALARWPLDSLNEELFLLKLRTIEVSVARHGLPDEALQKLAVDKLGRQFPGRSWPINRELSQLLVAFGAPEVVAKALDLRDNAPTQQEALHYQSILRLARNGWSTELRQRYFAWFHRRPRPTHPTAYTGWFHQVGIEPSNGASFDGFLRTIRQQAVASLADSEKGELAGWITGTAVTNTPPAAVAPKRKPRAHVQSWKMTDLQDRLATSTGNSAKGGAIYEEAQCSACHRLGSEGGAVGPNLTGAGARYSPVDLLRSLIEPSAVVSEQFQATVLTLKNGETVAGRITGESATVVSVLVDPINGRSHDFPKANIQSRSPSSVSPMPEGLLDTFTADEILDLLAFLTRP